jgi:hypothetical protein
MSESYSRVSGDYQHKEDNTTANHKSTHSIMAEFIDLYQVTIVNEKHVTVRCPLHISRQDQAHLRSNEKMQDL